MKIDLTYKEANLLNAVLWELGEEQSAVISGGWDAPSVPVWRLSDKGQALCKSIGGKLEDANEKENNRTGKDRDLSGSPKGSIQDARWEK